MSGKTHTKIFKSVSSILLHLSSEGLYAVVAQILWDDYQLCGAESKRQPHKAVCVNITSGLGSPLPFAASHIVLVLMSAHQQHV